jgi:hypothetical protein
MINENTAQPLADVTELTARGGLGQCDVDGCLEDASEVSRIETFRGSTLFNTCEKHLGEFRSYVWKFFKRD